VLQRLDRLTQDEGRMTVAQTLEVVHGLMNNVKVVMNGTQSLFGRRRRASEVVVIVDGKASTDSIHKALGMTFPHLHCKG